jgi:hypothetical protein
MKIIGLRIAPVARIAAIIYAAFGFLFWIAFSWSDVGVITLPVGVIAPLLHLNVNFNFPRSASVLVNCCYLLGSLVAYAVTGWLTAALAVTCFNLAAKLKGGFNTDFVLFRPERREMLAGPSPTEVHSC